jgi:hypothetical protein
MVGSPIVLVNRTGENIPFTADSRHYILHPGDNFGYTEGHAQFAMKQNPLMGSEDYLTLEFQSLVGYKLDGKEIYPCAALSDEELLASMDSRERFDRNGAGLGNVKFVKPRHPQPGYGRVAASSANANALAVAG